MDFGNYPNPTEPTRIICSVIWLDIYSKSTTLVKALRHGKINPK